MPDTTPAVATDGRSPETAWPVRELSSKLRDYIARLSRVWIEGQVVEVSRRSGPFVYLTVRDVDTEASVAVVLNPSVDRSVRPPLAAGQRVLLHVQCEFWMKNGRLMLRAGEVRPAGIGQLLATLELRKQQLAAEGLFATALKRPLPLLPRSIGLITGTNAQAKHDVIVNACSRWPAARFEVREGPVQGAGAVASMIGFLRELDGIEDVEVIVFARGGGSLEDLLPFSDEALVRAVAACRTPVVSAIGHEQDSPLLDLVADVRASTPTDAGKRVVPELAAELRWLRDARNRLDGHITAMLTHERTWLEQTRRRPVLAEPGAWLPRQEAEVRLCRQRCWRALSARLDREHATLAHLRARAAAMSPLATLQRGYAIVLDANGALVRTSGAVEPGDRVAVRLAAGGFHARVTDVASGP